MKIRKSAKHVLAVVLVLMLSSGIMEALAQPSADRPQKSGNTQHYRAQDNTQYFGPLRDIPVMPALQPVKEAASVFDKPAGRIVQVRATGYNVTGEAVRRFYAGTLPALGWEPRNGRIYIRGNEKLTLELARKGREMILDLQVKPLADERAGH